MCIRDSTNTVYTEATKYNTTRSTGTSRSTSTVYATSTVFNTSKSTTTVYSTAASLTAYASTGSSSQSFVCFEFISNTYYGTAISGNVPQANSNSFVYALNNTNFPLADGWYGAHSASGFAPDTKYRVLGGSGNVQSVQGCSGGFSDRKLKKNIKLIGKSDNGLNIYSFEYKDKKYGDGVWQGVIADEVEHITDAVMEFKGYQCVDYLAKGIDVEFKQI